MPASIKDKDSSQVAPDNTIDDARVRRIHAKVVALLGGITAIYELIQMGVKKQPPTEILSPLMSLAKKCNLTSLLELEKLFKGEHQQKPEIKNYKSALGIKGTKNDDKTLKKIARAATNFSTLLANLESDYEELPESSDVKEDVAKPRDKPKATPNEEVIKKTIQRLKDLRKKLPRVTFTDINKPPKSKFADLEKLSEINRVLALNFERTARHIASSLPHLDQTEIDKLLKKFLKIRLEADIPLSQKAQEIIKV